MFLEFFFIALIAISVTIFLLLRRKLLCIIGGFLYLILGCMGWLYMIFICYIIFGTKVLEFFDKKYSEQYWHIILFIIQIGLLAVRLYTCYLIKMMYKSLGFYESYRREKEHAEFLEKLGQKMDDGKNDGNNKDSNNNNICEIKFDEDEENNDEYNENQI